MTKQESITVYSIPSGMGGAHTVSIVEEMGEKVKVRIWYGRPSPTGWESWGEWDGQTRIVDRASLTRERTQKLVRLPEETDAGWMFCQSFEVEGYSPDKVATKRLMAFWEGELFRIHELDARGDTLKIYRASPSELTAEQMEKAKAARDELIGNTITIWERGQTTAA